jgi:hypothetical protein
MLYYYYKGKHTASPTTEGNSMAKLADLATKPVKAGRSFKASSWRAVDIDGDTRHIYHYATLMAELTKGELTQVSEGWGSVSDKQGMGKIRNALRKASPAK